MLSNLNHPNVLRFYGVVVESYAEPNVIGIMTEYMKGGSLAAFLRSHLPTLHVAACLCMPWWWIICQFTRRPHAEFYADH